MPTAGAGGDACVRSGGFLPQLTGTPMGAHAEGAQAGTHPGPFEVSPASAGDKIKELPAALASILIILTQQDRRGTWS